MQVFLVRERFPRSVFVFSSSAFVQPVRKSYGVFAVNHPRPPTDTGYDAAEFCTQTLRTNECWDFSVARARTIEAVVFAARANKLQKTTLARAHKEHVIHVPAPAVPCAVCN